MARLSREDWVDAAYARFADQGIDAVAVEPVARHIGATKGSFYWHFPDRAALVSAVLERWEREETDAVVAVVEEASDPRERLERLVRIVTLRTPQRGGEVTLYTAAERNGVADTVARVTESRVAFVASLLTALGIPEREARRRAVTLVSAVIGYQQLLVPGWDPKAVPPEAIAASLVHATIGDLPTP